MEGADFVSFLNIQKLETLGFGAKNETKALREAIKRIAELGNTTKHNKTAAAFNGDQLANDLHTMEKMLLVLAQSAKGKT